MKNDQLLFQILNVTYSDCAHYNKRKYHVKINQEVHFYNSGRSVPQKCAKFFRVPGVKRGCVALSWRVKNVPNNEFKDEKKILLHTQG